MTYPQQPQPWRPQQPPQPGWQPQQLPHQYWPAQNQWPQQQPVQQFYPAHHKVVTHKPANHVLHLILTILTCGLWLPVWILAAIKGRREVTKYR